MATERQCCYCSYEEHLSTDIQCPVVGIGVPCSNAGLIETYGTLAAALKFYGLDGGSSSRSAAAPVIPYPTAH